MDRLAIIVVVLIAFIVLYLHGLQHKTEEERYEGVIAVYMFACCFTKFFLPIYDYDNEQPYGSFGMSAMIWPYMLFCFYLLWQIMVRHGGFQSKPSKMVIGAFLAFAAYNVLNPANSVVGSSMIVLFFIGTLLIFYYLLANAFTAQTLVRGIFKGIGVHRMLRGIPVHSLSYIGQKW